MSSNNKPICVYHGSGLSQSLVVSHAGRAATGLQEHRYLHTGICVCLNYVNSSTEVQLGKNSSCGLLWKRCFWLHSAMFEQLDVFFSDYFNSWIFSVHHGSVVPHTDHRQQTPDFWVTGLLQRMQNVDVLGVRRLARAPAAQRNPVPRWSALLGPAGAPKHANWKTHFEEKRVVFFPWNELFLWTSLPGSLLGRIFAEMECKSGANAAKLNTFTDVKGSASLGLQNSLGWGLSLCVDL